VTDTKHIAKELQKHGVGSEDLLLAVKQEIARRKLLEFTLYIKHDYHVNWHHKYVAEILDDFSVGKTKNLMLFMPPQTGKFLPGNTPVWTPLGWRWHRFLKRGDLVFGQDGKTKVVQEVTAPYEWDLMKIEFNDGNTIEASPEHLWKIVVGGKEVIVETKHILDYRNPYIDCVKSSANKKKFFIKSITKEGIATRNCIQVEGRLYQTEKLQEGNLLVQLVNQEGLF